MVDLSKRSLLTLLDFLRRRDRVFAGAGRSAEERQVYRSGKKDAAGQEHRAAVREGFDPVRDASFEVAAYDQGARVTYLGPTGSQVGKKESIKDTARVLGRMYDGIEYRGFAQRIVHTLAEYCGRSACWNGLTNEFHPTQALADMMTMREHTQKPLSEIWKICFFGRRAQQCGQFADGGLGQRWGWTSGRSRPSSALPMLRW